MTLGQCLEEIKRLYLNGSNELMTSIGFKVVREIKHNYFKGQEYPRKGWLLSLEPSGPYLVHKQARVCVPLDSNLVELGKRKKAVDLLEASKNERKRILESYEQYRQRLAMEEEMKKLKRLKSLSKGPTITQ